MRAPAVEVVGEREVGFVFERREVSAWRNAFWRRAKGRYWFAEIVGSEFGGGDDRASAISVSCSLFESLLLVPS